MRFTDCVNSWDPEPDSYGLAMGSLDDDPGVRPLCHVSVNLRKAQCGHSAMHSGTLAGSAPIRYTYVANAAIPAIELLCAPTFRVPYSPSF